MNSLFQTEVFARTADAPLTAYNTPVVDGSNFTSVTKGLSETNSMPGHGRNVHEDALRRDCDYFSFNETLARVNSSRYAHSPYAIHTTMRFRNVAFERLPTVIPDIQCILFALFGAEPVVFNLRPRVDGTPYVEVDVVTMNPQRILSILSQKVIVIDRHGFHVARGTVSTRSVRVRRNGPNGLVTRDTTVPNSTETAAVLDYCKAVRQLPQKDRHFKTDGLPCVPLRVELPNLTTPVAY